MSSWRVPILLLLVLSPGIAAGRGQPDLLLTPQQWEQALRERGLDPSTRANPLAFTEAMREEAQRGAGEGKPLERLERLQRYLFEIHPEPFDYEGFNTLTATEAFESRRGNCVAFTNLFIAMARSLDLPVRPALIYGSGDPETDGDLVMVKSHIVAVYPLGRGTMVFDFSSLRGGPPVGVRPVSDLWIAAIYESNLGVKALREDRVDEALERFDNALRLAPDYADLYGNLGVARRRAGDLNGAFDAYLMALQIDPANTVSRDNLFEIFADLVRERRTGAAPDGTESPAAEWIAQADEELLDGEVARASRSYRKAHRAAPETVDPLVWVARCDLLRGQVSGARRKLAAALELDPRNADARRLLEGLDRVRDLH